MATIGSLIIEIAGDNSRLKRALADSKGLTDDYKEDIKAARLEFAESATRLREDLFRGVLSPAEFKKQGIVAAREYNTAVLENIDAVRAAGQLTPRLHAALVTELREAGLEAGEEMGKAIVQGEEETAGAAVPSAITRRFQSTGVMVAFALEGMANGSESMSRRALRSISALAFAFGPEAGGITLAITTATQYLIDFFRKANTEAENTMRQFRSHLAELVRSGSLPGVQRELQTIYSGDVAADVEGQRKGESDAAFEARRVGIRGLTLEIARLKQQQDSLTRTGNAAESPFATLTTDAGEFRQNMRAIASDNAAGKVKAQIKALTDQLVFLKEQQGHIAPVFGALVAGAAQASETKIERKEAGAHKKDPVDLLEQQLSQIVQTQTAIKAVGGDATVLRGTLVDLWYTAGRALSDHGNALDKTGIHLQEIIARAQEALGLTRKVLTLPGIQFARPNAMHEQGATVGAGVSLFGQPLTSMAPAFQQAAGFLAGPTVGNIKTGPAALPTAAEARLNLALDEVREHLSRFAGGLKDAVASGFFATLRSIAGQLNPFSEVITAISRAAAPLAPVMAYLGAIVARDLVPIFKAFQPVLIQLIPVIDAVMRVLAPIVSALAPMFQAFIPILRALFPLFKEGAIVSTYLFQAFATGASIFLRMVGNVVIGFGVILKALATAIDKLPFVSAKGAINAAQGIIDFGNSLLQSSDDFKQAAGDMADARDAIKKTTFDDTTASVKSLGEAAAETADAINNANTWWKSAFAIWSASNARQDGTPFSGPNPPGGPERATPSGVFAVPNALTGGGTGGGGAFAPTGTSSGPSFTVNVDKLQVTQPVVDGRTLLRQVIAEAQRTSQATFGTTARWAEVL